ncbi:MAG: GDP-mannose 4,6-dehydratase [Acidimicrobiia bacterium]
MKVCITGQAGFVGAHLATQCSAAGDELVPFEDLDHNPIDVLDADAVHEMFTRERPEVVYHLAALTHVGESWSAPAEVWRVNTEGTCNVLAAAPTGTRVIVISSADTYGAAIGAEPLDECVTTLPLSPYGASKAAAELLAQRAARVGTEVVIARAFNHTGPGQRADFVVPALAARVVQAETHGNTEVVVGNLDAVRDISHVADVVSAYRALSQHGNSGEIYNVCSGTGTRVRDIAEHFIQAAAIPLELRVDPALVRPIDIPVLIGDNTKLRSHTGWEPRYTIAQTLDDVLEAARHRVTVPQNR